MIIRDTSSADFEQPEAGTHPAICFKIVDLGTQTGRWEGEQIVRRQVIISWEIEEKMKDGKPFSVSHFYTASLHEKANLRRDLESWRGKKFTDDELKGFNIKNLLGKSCLVSIIKNEKGKTKLSTVSQMPKSMAPIQQVNPSVHFSFDEFDQSVFDNLTNGYKKIIMQSPEFQALSSTNSLGKGDAQDEQLPF